MEIRIVPDDIDFGNAVNFDWDILGYDTENIWLQL